MNIIGVLLNECWYFYTKYNCIQQCGSFFGGTTVHNDIVGNEMADKLTRCRVWSQI